MTFMRAMSTCAAAIITMSLAAAATANSQSAPATGPKIAPAAGTRPTATTRPAASTRPAAATTAPPAGVRVWNYEVLGDAYRVTDPGPVGPITIPGARNGTFSGCVAVESGKPITGLKASVGALTKDTASIPAAQVAVRYAVSWGPEEGNPAGLDILLESSPATVAVLKDRALAGVWVTVTVPDDAAAGVYRGELKVEAAGLPAQTIPIELTVADLRLPNAQDFRTWIEMIQSPDTLALEYGVPQWSEKHLALIARSFQLIRPTGSRVVFVPLLRNTNQGNSESMVRWVRQKDGTLKPDYANMDKYLDLAQKNLGDLKLVVFYAWDSYLVTSYRNESYTERPTTSGPALDRWELRNKGLTVTMLDEATGKTEPGFLPLYTAPESKAIWEPVYTELRARMKARGLEKAMALGMVCDQEPSKEEVLFLKEVTGGLAWICHSHFMRTAGKPSPNTQLRGVGDIRYEAHASKAYQVNPDKGRLYGWQVSELRADLDRFGEHNGPSLRIRQVPLLNISGRQRGVGRLGGDFWNVIKDPRGKRAGQTFARYPENAWRGLNIASWFLAPGPEGPVATARLENLREGVQECEARILIESALTNAGRKSQLGEDLAQRAQTVLDEHQRALWRSIWTNEEHLKVLGTMSGRNRYEALWEGLPRAGIKLPGFWDGPARTMRSEESNKGFDWFVASGWQQRDKQLFAAAAEVQQRIK